MKENVNESAACCGSPPPLRAACTQWLNDWACCHRYPQVEGLRQLWMENMNASGRWTLSRVTEKSCTTCRLRAEKGGRPKTRGNLRSTKIESAAVERLTVWELWRNSFRVKKKKKCKKTNLVSFNFPGQYQQSYPNQRGSRRFTRAWYVPLWRFNEESWKHSSKHKSLK